MKIENLKVGQVLKNYKELCEILDINIATGNARIKQLKTLAEGVEYHKEGNKFVIDKIIKKVEIMDKRKLGNNNDISKNLRYMILDLLSRHNEQEKYEIGFSKTLIYRHCGMINHNYRNAKGNKKAWAESLNITELAIEECLDYTDDRLSGTLRRACSTLQNTNKALSYRFGYNYILKGKNNEVDTQHTAYQELENIIRDTEYEVMEQMNIRRYEYIYKFGRWNEFKSKVMEILEENYPIYFENIKYYYNALVFNFTSETIEHCKASFEKRFELNTSIAKANVNQYFSESLDGTIKNRHKKIIDSDIFGKNFDSIDDYRGDKIYVPEQKECKDSIIKLEYKQLSFSTIKNHDSDDENIPF